MLELTVKAALYRHLGPLKWDKTIWGLYFAAESTVQSLASASKTVILSLLEPFKLIALGIKIQKISFERTNIKM